MIGYSEKIHLFLERVISEIQTMDLSTVKGKEIMIFLVGGFVGGIVGILAAYYDPDSFWIYSSPKLAIYLLGSRYRARIFYMLLGLFLFISTSFGWVIFLFYQK
jgi:hypothetical protein